MYSNTSTGMSTAAAAVSSLIAIFRFGHKKRYVGIFFQDVNSLNIHYYMFLQNIILYTI